MIVLAMDASALPALAGVVDEDGTVLEAIRIAEGQDTGSALAAAVAVLLSRHGPPGRIAAVTGPGSFTGIRASLALARGFADAAGVPLQGVPLDVAFAPLREASPERPLLIAVPARPGWLHFHDGGTWQTVPEREVPPVAGPVSAAGTAAGLLAANLAARGADVRLLDARRPDLAAIAEGARTALPAEPLYVDPPRARAAPLRPPPA